MRGIVLTHCKGFPQGAMGGQDGVGMDEVSPRPSGRLSVKIKLKATAQPASSEGESLRAFSIVLPFFCLSSTRSRSRRRQRRRCRGSRRM